MITFILFLWLIPIAVNVYVDRNGRKPYYPLVFIFRGAAAIIHGVIFDLVLDYFPKDWYGYNLWDTVLIMAPLILFQLTSFWILFELALNHVRGREPFYFDRTENDSGWIDKLFDKLGNGAHLLAKVIALIVCILSIITLYNRV